MTLYLSDGDEPPSCGNDDGTSNVSCQSTVYTKSSLSEVASQVDFSDFYKDVSEWISSLGGGESLPGTCSSMGSPQSRSNQGLEPLDAKFLVSALTELDALNSVSASNESSVSTSNPLAGFYQSPLSSYNDDTIRDRNDYDANNGSKSFIQHHHSSLQAVLSSLLLGGLSLGEAIEHGVNRAASTATIAANRFRDSLSYQRDLNMTASEGFSHAKLRESDAEYRHSDDQFSYNSATHVDTRCFTNECKVCRSNEMQGNMATSSCSPAATSSESCYSPVNGLRGLAESVLYAVAAALGTTRAGSGLTSVAMICWALVQSSIGELRRLQSIVCHMGSNVTQLRDCLEKTIQRLGEVRKDLYDMTEAKQRIQNWIDSALDRVPSAVRSQIPTVFQPQSTSTTLQQPSAQFIPPPPPTQPRLGRVPPPPAYAPSSTLHRHQGFYEGAYRLESDYVSKPDTKDDARRIERRRHRCDRGNYLYSPVNGG